MESIQFDGQQSDERILTIIRPHVLSKWVAIGTWIFLAITFFVVVSVIGNIAGTMETLFSLISLPISALIILAGFWWNSIVYEKSKTFLTDRRIMRFEQVSPLFAAKRGLFWNEVLKAKAFSPNIIFRVFNIGRVVVEAHEPIEESVFVDNVFMFEDVANYIDKILYIYKNKPTEIATIKPFITKPKGHRD